MKTEKSPRKLTTKESTDIGDRLANKKPLKYQSMLVSDWKDRPTLILEGDHEYFLIPDANQFRDKLDAAIHTYYMAKIHGSTQSHRARRKP